VTLALHVLALTQSLVVAVGSDWKRGEAGKGWKGQSWNGKG